MLIPFFIRTVGSMTLESTITEIVTTSQKLDKAKDALRILFDIAHRYIQNSELDSLRKTYEGIERIMKNVFKNEACSEKSIKQKDDISNDLFARMRRQRTQILQRDDREMIGIIFDLTKHLVKVSSDSDLYAKTMDFLIGMFKQIDLHSEHLSHKHLYLRDIVSTNLDIIENLMLETGKSAELTKWVRELSNKLPAVVRDKNRRPFSSLSSMAARCVEVFCKVDNNLIAHEEREVKFSITAILKYFADVGDESKSQMIDSFTELINSNLCKDSGLSSAELLRSLAGTKAHWKYLQILLAAYTVMYSDKCSATSLKKVLDLHKRSLDNWIGDNAAEKLLKRHFKELKTKIKSLSSSELRKEVKEQFTGLKIQCTRKKTSYDRKEHWEILCNELETLIGEL